MTIGYATTEELTAYAGARGVTVADPDIALNKALDWLELQSFSGSKTDPDQALEFPRNGLTVVPAKIKTAQLVAALLVNAGEDLLAPQNQRVISESVAGAVSVEYSDTGRQSTYYPQLRMLIREFLVGSGHTFGVTRG